MTTKKIIIFLSLGYLIFGNIVGYLISRMLVAPDGLLFYLFFPYSATFVLSSLVGWDWLSIVFEIVAYFASFLVLIPIGLYFGKFSKHGEN